MALYPTIAALYYYLYLDYNPLPFYVISKIVQLIIAIWVFLRFRGLPRVKSFNKISVSLTITSTVFPPLLLFLAILVFSYTQSWENVQRAIVEKIYLFSLHNWYIYFVFATVISFLHSFMEEFYWRIVFFNLLRNSFTFLKSSFFSSLFFSLHHLVVIIELAGDNNYFVVALAWVAIILGFSWWNWLYVATGSIVYPWVSHILCDKVIFIFGWFAFLSMYSSF